MILKSWTLDFPDPQPLGEITLDLTYSYDIDGILHVTAEDSLGNVLLSDDVSYGQGVEKRDLPKIANRVARTLDSDRIETSVDRAASALSAAEQRIVTEVKTKVIPFIEDAEAAELRSLISSAEAGDESAIPSLQSAVRKYSYLL